MKKIRKVCPLLGILLILCALSACEHHVGHFTIERDGPIQALSLAEFSSLELTPPFIDEFLTVELTYFGIYSYMQPSSMTSPELLLALQQKNDMVVNNQIYNFVVMVPIKTRQRLFTLSYSNIPGGVFPLQRCKPLYVGDINRDGFLPELLTAEKQTDEQGFYHYRLYAGSNQIEVLYFLNPVRDWCVQYRDVHSVAYGDSWDITSNTITIPAQEVRAMLDGLGIAHELDALDN